MSVFFLFPIIPLTLLLDSLVSFSVQSSNLIALIIRTFSSSFFFLPFSHWRSNAIKKECAEILDSSRKLNSIKHTISRTEAEIRRSARINFKLFFSRPPPLNLPFMLDAKSRNGSMRKDSLPLSQPFPETMSCEKLPIQLRARWEGQRKRNFPSGILQSFSDLLGEMGIFVLF